MVKGTSGWTILKYWSKQMPMVWRPGTIFWMLTPACFTLSLKRKHGPMLQFMSLWVQTKQLFITFPDLAFLEHMAYFWAKFLPGQCSATQPWMHALHSKTKPQERNAVIEMLLSVNCEKPPKLPAIIPACISVGLTNSLTGENLRILQEKIWEIGVSCISKWK